MVAVPMIIQNTLTNVVSLLDNVMVGRIGTIPMSSVAIVSQLILIFYLCTWGGVSGAGIFGAQFFGSGDHEGVRQTTRFKLIMMGIFTAAACTVFLLFGERFIRLYIAADTAPEDALETVRLASQYLHIMLVGLIPFAVTQVFSSSMRESGRTALPMKAGLTAMAVNFVFNALLIFGLFGFPRLGVRGAAWATVISRFTELAVILGFGMRDKKNYGYLRGVFREFRVPAALSARIVRKAFPLMVNEFLWSGAEAVMLQTYSIRGIGVVAAMNIAGVVSLVFNEFSLSLGNAAGILAGQELGAGRFGEAKKTAVRIMVVSYAACFILGAVLFLVAPLIPRAYNTEESVRALAVQCIRVLAFWMPVWGLSNIAYFTVRSGGQVVITFLFDSIFTWVVKVLALRLLVTRTALEIVPIYFIVNGLEIIKVIVGILLLMSGIWMRNLTEREDTE